MDEKVMDIFLFRNISLLLFLKSFKKAERHSNKITDLSWLINCARVFADEGRQVALSLVVYEGTGLCHVLSANWKVPRIAHHVILAGGTAHPPEQEGQPVILTT
jgi:hypothetical protein